jgi:hypothetical protein
MEQRKVLSKILLERNIVPIVRSNHAYDVPYSTITNPCSNQIIKAYNAYIPDEAMDKQYLSMAPSTINHNIDNQPKLRECNPSEELHTWHQRLAHMPFSLLQHMENIGHLPKRLSSI